jgi:spermidine synthase
VPLITRFSQTIPYEGSPETDRVSPAVLWFLLLLFVGSGACALIYEVVWFQLLELVIGSSAISLAVLLATFMGGMCIGSLAFPKYVPRGRHPLQVYAILELSIGIIGMLELFAIPLVGRLYSPAVGHGTAALALRAVVAGLSLLPPAILMGATLPAIARWVGSSPRGISWLGFLYGGNIAGGVIGSVLAGFYLLRVHDQSIATYVAVLLNGAVAVVAWVISMRTQAPLIGVEPVVSSSEPATNAIRADHGAIYFVIGLSGACALGAQVLWTRLLSLTFGASVYTFSMILAVFLSGLGIGSAAGAALVRIIPSPRRALAWCQLLLTAAIAWAAAVIYVALPNWPIDPSLAPSPWFALQLDLVRCTLVVLPASILWGASFPFALAAIARPDDDTARLVGRVYAANTIGAIVGAIACSLVLIPSLGTRDAQRVLIAVAAGASMLALLAPRSIAGRSIAGPTKTKGAASGGRSHVALLLTPIMAALLIVTVPELPGTLVAYGRNGVAWIDRAESLYIGEGMNSSVAVTRIASSGSTHFHVSGKVEASNLPQDMRLQKMLAHLPALVHPNPRSVLVVGFGAGVTAGSFLPYPSVTRLVICEIEVLIPRVVSTWFAVENNNVATDPRTQIFYDDARSFVLTTDEKFDVITSDPINPWVKGAASLYTREYFESVKRHLKPGGVVTQWVPLYESTTEAVRSQLATFFEVFPEGTIWANTISGRGYDVVLLGPGPTRIDIGALDRRFQGSGYERVGESLTESGFESPIALFSTYLGSGRDLAEWLRGAEINTDRNLRLQYLAGMGLNSYSAESIFQEIIQYRKFPGALFIADDQWKETLSEAMGLRRDG